MDVHFWTFQRKEIAKQLVTESYYPIFKEDSKRTYKDILRICNEIGNSHYLGLAFGHVGNEESLLSPSAFFRELRKYQAPSGTYFPSNTHSLLHLIIPPTISVLSIGFYNFSDALFFEEEGPEIEYEHSIQLIQSDDTRSYKQSHVGYIDKQWVAEVITEYESPILTHEFH